MIKRTKQIIAVVILGSAFIFIGYLATPGFKQKKQTVPPKLAGGPEKDVRFLGEINLERLYPEIVLRQSRSGEKTVALTFDDGPDDLYTPAVLDILKSKEVRATFFLIGNRVEKYPETTQRIIEEGHLIGNHTYSHVNTGRPLGQLLKIEIQRMEATLEPFGIDPSYLFRPPYGAVSVPSALEIANLGYRLALWSVDSLDWTGLTKEEVLRNIMSQMEPGRVVLQHSGGGPGENLSGSVLALPELIDTLKQQGYDFLTMDEMFPKSP